MSVVSCGNYHVVDIDLDIASDLLPEAFLHHTLLSGTRIFQTKGHDLIAVTSKG
jgi:hypothetical protein